MEILGICLGACAGALCRWLLNLGLNSIFPPLPPGTLAANLLGSFLMGIALGLFSSFPALNAQWRPFVITGFLGSLTTFSAFAGEMGALVSAGKMGMLIAGLTLHVGGSLIMLFLGMYIFGVIMK